MELATDLTSDACYMGAKADQIESVPSLHSEIITGGAKGCGAKRPIMWRGGGRRQGLLPHPRVTVTRRLGMRPAEKEARTWTEWCTQCCA